MKKLIIGTLVILGILALLLPKFLGSQGSKIHDDFFQERAQQVLPGVTIESEKMDDGWFNSEGQHRIKLSQAILKRIPGVKNIELNKETDLIVNTKFHHGPFAFSSFSTEGSAFSPVLAVAESTFKIDNGNGELINVPGKMFTQVNPTGTRGKAKYLIEAYSNKTDDAQVDFDGLVLDFDISDKGEVIDGKGHSGKLSVVGNNGEKFILNKMKFKADLEDESGLWFGDGSLQFSDFSFNDGQGRSFALSNVNFEGENKGDDKSMDNKMKFSIGEFVISDMKFEDFTFDYGIDNLDTQAMIAIQEQSKATKSRRVKNNNPTMVSIFKELIAQSPTLNINELSVKTPQGKVMADMHLGLPKNVDTAFFPFSLLPQIEGDANIRVPKAVLPLLNGFRPGIAEQAEMLEQFGMLELKGDDYIAVLKMREGQFTINGNSLPVSDFIK